MQNQYKIQASCSKKKVSAHNFTFFFSKESHKNNVSLGLHQHQVQFQETKIT